jgi:hypothetical protein
VTTPAGGGGKATYGAWRGGEGDGAGWPGMVDVPGSAGNAVEPGCGAKPEGAGSSIGASRAGAAGAGAVPSNSVANARVPPYSTAAPRGTQSQRWITAQRMEKAARSGERHYM